LLEVLPQLAQKDGLELVIESHDLVVGLDIADLLFRLFNDLPGREEGLFACATASQKAFDVLL
jgi:hypothetical protein